jgi:hypothetical protein
MEGGTQQQQEAPAPQESANLDDFDPDEIPF